MRLNIEEFTRLIKSMDFDEEPACVVLMITDDKGETIRYTRLGEHGTDRLTMAVGTLLGNLVANYGVGCYRKVLEYAMVTKDETERMQLEDMAKAAKEISVVDQAKKIIDDMKRGGDDEKE